MSQFGIFSLLAFFYISYASAQENYACEPLRELEKAIIYPPGEANAIVFDKGEVNLFKIIGQEGGKLNYYVVGDNSKQDCEKFPIAQYVSIVTEESIVIKWSDQTIALILKAQSTFKFYQELFPEENFSREFNVTNVFQDGKWLFGITAIRAKRVEEGKWSFVAFKNGITPRLIFPESCLKVSPKDEHDYKVILIIDIRPETSVIGVHFDNSDDANEFYDFVREPREENIV